MPRTRPSQPFGQRLMNSMWTLATMVGASVTQLTQGTLVAQLGLTDIAFPAPLFHGDTLYTETEILEKRLSASRPGQGIVTMRHTGRNQDGDVVATATRVALMWCRRPTNPPRRRSRPHDPLPARARRCCSARPTARSGTRRRWSARTP